MDLNKTQIIGRLGADPEVRSLQTGTTVCSLRVAVSEKWKDRDGNPQEHTEWFTVEVWGKQAESCGQYLVKGQEVYVEGKLRTETYKDKDGQEKKAMKLRADNVSFGSKPNGQGDQGGRGNQGGQGGGGWGRDQNQGGGGQGQGQGQGQGGNQGGGQGQGGGWGRQDGWGQSGGHGGWGQGGGQGQGGGDPIPF